MTKRSERASTPRTASPVEQALPAERSGLTRALAAQYEAFLREKAVRAPTYGFEVSVDDLNPRLFDWQRAIVRWSLQRGRAAIFADCGLGKTPMQLEWSAQVCRHTDGNVLILAPLAVAQQTADEATKFGYDAITICRQQSDVRPGINITNYELLAKFDTSLFAGVVLDECFAPDTLIDTPTSKKRIQDIKTGDEIINAVGVDVVADVHRRAISYAIRIRVRGQTILSSPNHPYFTARGWIAAQDLTPSDRLVESSEAVRLLRQDLYCEAGTASQSAFLRDILLSEMANAAAGDSVEGACTGGGSEARRQEATMVGVGHTASGSGIGAHSPIEPDFKTRGASEDQPHIETATPQTFRAWGQWSRVDGAAAAAAGYAWRRMDSGVCLVTGPADSKLSHSLQARLSEHRAQNRYRSGWQLPLCEESAGCEKGCEAGYIGLDSLEVLEPGHPDLERFRHADGQLYFYDLGATRHPSFTVAGCLVHNSSILKSYMGKTKRALIEAFAQTPYRLCCTATPAPNDHMEIGNHSEFLGVMPSTEMLMRWFINDTMAMGNYRLKGHAVEDFWQWVASWAVALRKPSDLGYSDDGFTLPPLALRHEIVTVDLTEGAAEGQLFRTPDLNATGLHKELRRTTDDRADAVAALVNGSADIWVVWCNTNYEADALKSRIPNAIEVRGSESLAEKTRKIHAFSSGEKRVIIGKPSQLGFGLNWQHCHRMAFIGLSYSYEQFYQAVRRCWRFGQTRPVEAVVIAAETEGAVLASIERKMAAHEEMAIAMVAHAGSLTLREELALENYNPQLPMQLPTWLVDRKESIA